MAHSVKYRFFISQLNVIKTLCDTDKTKVSVVYDEQADTTRILRECKGRNLSSLCDTLIQVRHPNAVIVYNYVYDDGTTYILEEYINGESAQELLDKNGVFTEQQTAKIVIEVCKALEVFHKQTPPIIHNDITPNNIMLRDDGSVKLFDFDISRLYQKGKSQNTELLGTKEYASPEHFGYGQSEPRTDIYGLGATMHKMLTDHALSNEHKVVYNGKLKHIIEKCVAIDPKSRYTSVVQLRKELEKFLTQKRRRARRMWMILLIVALVGVGAFLFNKFDIADTLGLFKDTPPTGITSTTDEVSNNTTTTTLHVETTTGTSDITTTTAVATTTTQSPIIAPSQSTTQSTTAAQANDSRENAMPIALEQEHTGLLKEQSTAQWYKFTTSQNNAVYRLEATSDKQIDLALYEINGIKLTSTYVSSNTFFDIQLQPNTEYAVKISKDSVITDINYVVSVSELLCDTGIDKDSATTIQLDEPHTGILNSSFSDWYTFTPEEGGRYTVTLHNIDVGCRIDCSVENIDGSSSYGSTSARNEDNNKFFIHSPKGDPFYLEIKEWVSNSKPNGTYILVIEKTK